MVTGKYQELVARLKKHIPEERLIHDDLRLLAFGTDAGFYRLLPKLVVKIHNEAEAVQVIQNCKILNLPLTIRAAGTSLSGQSVSDSVLMLMVPSEWNKISVSDDGSEITVQPALEGGKINQKLAAFNKRIGPDPASINHAQIGGIVANNAAGMASGTRWNSYNTISGLRIVLNDGTILDTRDAKSREEFAKTNKSVSESVKKLSEKVEADKKIATRIKEKFSIKNTTGYSVNALIDFDDPIDIISHLMVGSEGTLGFVSEISMRTIDDPPFKATSLILFPDIASACNAIPLLQKCAVATAELMDRAALKSVENKKAMPDYLKTLDENVTALLVETRAADDKTLQIQVDEIKQTLAKVALVKPIEFTTDSLAIAGLWSVRKGLFPSVAASREKGTTVIIEDICVPQKHLANALLGLQDLFKKYTYDTSIIWGHALDGNVHFVITQNFNQESELKRYDAFMAELVAMVLDKYDGSLKAEHGTGRNMAPFVEREWGSDIYNVMRELKQILDAEGVFNPGVILNEDPELHLKNLKPLPVAHDLIDNCIECGFCENNCVSRELTLSPRQRIAVYREIKQLLNSGHESHRLAQLNRDYDYYGDQTCATDGLCALSCPVDIDTGKLIKELRRTKNSENSKNIANWLAEHMDRVTTAMRFGLGTVSIFHKLFGDSTFRSLTQLMRKITFNRLPQWVPAMPTSGKAMQPVSGTQTAEQKVIYFPTCINRAMGVSKDYDEQVPLTDKIMSLLKKAGYEVIIPDNVNNLCCGMAFSSKGHIEAAHKKETELDAALLKASENGKYPVLADMSPCLYHMKETLSSDLKLFEPIEFTLKYLKDRLSFEKSNEPIAIFSVCSAKKMDLENQFLELAHLCTDNVTVIESNCCGFAGDRGFTYPELNAEGLKSVKEQIPSDMKHGYATSRTCEIGLTEHSGISYKSILYLVDKCSTAKK